MKKVLFLLMGWAAIPAQAQTVTATKLSPLTRLFLHDIQQQAGTNPVIPQGYVYKKDASGNKMLSALVQVKKDTDPAQLEALGIKIGTKAGTTWTVQIPYMQLDRFSKMNAVRYIQLDAPMATTMDSARAVAHVNEVHNGLSPLPMPYTGKNVVVGILDAGFDYNHPTLLDTSGNKLRIKKVWEQKSTGTPPAGYAYGNELTDTTMMRTVGTDKANFSHGAHVAGIAAGSGFGSPDKKFMGMAFESDLVLVGITPDSTQWIETGVSDIIDGMNYIYNYAASVSKPAVANLSWGTTLGPHDGSGLFSQACDALTGEGKLFVCSAGNNGTDNVHIRKVFSATDTSVFTMLNLHGTAMNKTWIDIWGDTDKSFCLKVTLFDAFDEGPSTIDLCTDDKEYHTFLVGTDKDTCFLDVVSNSADFNEKPRLFVRIYQKTTNRMRMTLKANGGTVNMWNGYVANAIGYYVPFSAGMTGAVAGNPDYGIGDVADTRSAIAVASHASKIKFTNLAGGVVDYSTYVTFGKLAPYSSHGPTVDGRIKPDIAGPGLMIGSAANSSDPSYKPGGANASSVVHSYTSPKDGKDYYYAMMTGTSMSSPAVAGIVALLLEANPKLSPEWVNRILAETAMQDSYTGTLPPEGTALWGHGKVNAYAAMEKTLATLGVYTPSGINAADCRLYPNPGNGAFEIAYNSARAETLRVELYDISGRVVFSENWAVQAGANHKQYNTSLGTGMYVTKISSPLKGSISIKTVIR
jgi:subtilisin family serine protease